ncbi:MAG TPA: hypothetical protein VE422_49100 [Terriglobia bacterium]|nr:hypothetical protein [Terriglobia bacterium]
MTSKDGKAATEIKILIYAPGCKIQRISLALLNSSSVSENFVCNGLPNVTLAGQIKPDEMRRAGNGELQINYMAYWAHEFFGIIDGLVLEIRLGPVSLDDDGMFRVDLPDFDLESPESASFKPSASFRLRLRDAQTGNPIIDNLIPELPEFRSAEGHLSIRSAYPLGMQFTSEPTSDSRGSSGICKPFISCSASGRINRQTTDICFHR